MITLKGKKKQKVIIELNNICLFLINFLRGARCSPWTVKLTKGGREISFWRWFSEECTEIVFKAVWSGKNVESEILKNGLFAEEKRNQYLCFFFHPRKKKKISLVFDIYFIFYCFLCVSKKQSCLRWDWKCECFPKKNCILVENLKTLLFIDVNVYFYILLERWKNCFTKWLFQFMLSS